MSRKGKPIEEYIGKKYGRLTVLEIIPRSQSKFKICRSMVCKCDCGNIIEARFENVTFGTTTSCGCYYNEQHKNWKHKIGTKYNRLTYIDDADDIINKNGEHKRRIVCKCDCGNVVVLNKSDVVSGRTKSCGCLKVESAHSSCVDDITGKIFHELTAIKRIHGVGKGHSSIWLFKCSCGNEIEANASNVKRGLTKSCGHIKGSIAEYEIMNYLKNHNIEFMHNVKPFNDMVNPNTGKKLELDFAIKDANGYMFYIEHQGIQHFIENPYQKHFWKNQREVTDKIKRDYCKQKGIRLYETLYNEDYIQHLESILKENGLLN